jgi:flavorubredoxin
MGEIMSHETLAPPPYEIARDTWVIPELFPAGPDAYVPINSMVITGAEPVIVDTGTALNRRRWLDAVGSVVDFADVRWIFLSHDDHDHTGNLEQVLELCPDATFVSTWFQMERLAGDLRVPLDRVRWIRDGESFDAGDRELLAVRPPVYDSPTTRGLFDPTTGVYWASDAFAALVPEHLVDAADVPEPMWQETFLQLNRLISPWHTMVDPQKYGALVDRFTALGANVVAAAHTAAVRSERLVAGVELLRSLPDLDEAVEFGQADLEAMLSAMQAAA